MELLGRADADLFGVLPYVAVALLSLGGYLVSRHGRKSVVDSPWLWTFAFSAVGLVGVWAISRKYDDREKRLETRYEARQRIAERRALETNPSSTPNTEGNAAPRSGYDAKRQVPLRFLAGGLLILALGSGLMLWRTAVRPDQNVDPPDGT